MQATYQPQHGTFARRPLDVEDYLNIVRRHVGWILGPTLAGLTIAVVVAYFWPDTYMSTAAIRVVPPAVPEKLVPTNVNMQMAERVEAMKQTILSRTTLNNIIQTFDLYRHERTKLPMEDVIEMMTRAVFIGTPQRLGGRTNAAAFRISFAYSDKYTAQRVTRDLMTRFIDENLRERFQQSQSTTSFMKDQYDAAKLELDEIERRMTDFRMQNQGRLPDSMGMTIQQMGALESRVAALNSNVSRVRQEQMMTEAEMRATRERLNALLKLPADAPVTASSVGSRGGQGGDSEIDQEILRVDRETQTLERALERMLEQYTSTWPDVQRHQIRIQALKKEKDGLLNKKLTIRDDTKPVAGSSLTPARMNPARAREVAELEANITRLQGQIKAKEMESERYIQEIADADRRSREVQSRIESSPLGAAQLQQLVREHELSQRRHDDAKVRYSQSLTASELEKRQQGETLEQLEAPSLPERPTDPKRPIIIGVGAFIGLVIGAAMAAIRELKDTSLKSLKDIRAYTQFNVLGSVPLLENDFVTKRRRRRAMLGWASAVVVSVLVMAIAVYHYHYIANG